MSIVVRSYSTMNARAAAETMSTATITSMALSIVPYVSMVVCTYPTVVTSRSARSASASRSRAASPAGAVAYQVP